MSIDRRANDERRIQISRYLQPERRNRVRRQTLQQAFLWHYSQAKSLR